MKKSVKNPYIKALFLKKPLCTICMCLIIVFVLGAIFAPILTKYEPTEQHLSDQFSKITPEHPLGADHLGRDLLTRLLYGARVSLLTSLLSTAIAAIIGLTLGLIAGYFGGFLGQAIMRIMDAQLSIPPLVLTMVLATLFCGGVVGVSIVIGISMVPTYVRMVNAMVISLKNNDYVIAAKLVGQSNAKILIRHLLPNCFPSLIVLITMNLGNAIMLESSLSYLGIGITPPTPAWGSMVSEGYNYLMNYPLIAILPGLCVMLTVVAFNIVGDALRDTLDPRLRGKL